MDAIDFATSVARGLDIELPSVMDLAAWDRLTADAARLARELGFPLAGADYDRMCPTHSDDFVMRSLPSVWDGRILTFTCGCREWPQFSGPARLTPATYMYSTSS